MYQPPVIDDSDSDSEPPASITGFNDTEPFLESNWKYDLDPWLQLIYFYYQQQGLTPLLLEQSLNLLSILVVVFLTLFTSSCIDYAQIHTHKRLGDILVDNCLQEMGLLSFLFLLVCGCYWTVQLYTFIVSIPKYYQMQQFYEQVLKIKDSDLEHMEWSKVVDAIVHSRQQQGLFPLDAIQIANRIHRRDNYWIAMVSKDLLQLEIPFMGKVLSTLVEWSIEYCVFSLLFDARGLKKRVLDPRYKQKLTEQLEQRFKALGIASLVLMPFTLVFMIANSLFQFIHEYQKSPANAIGFRNYSTFALWLFREYNEYPHFLRQRLNKSHPHANQYLGQFPSRVLTLVAKTVGFISGSITGFLVVITLFEEELQQGFEITPGRSAFFYIGLFGTISALSSNFVPLETVVFEPVTIMTRVVEQTHYLPLEWKDKFHTNQVRDQFSALFPQRLVLMIQEWISCLYLPYLLYYRWPEQAGSVLEFLAQHTVNDPVNGPIVDYGLFDLEKIQEVKMTMSMAHFRNAHPNWQPQSVLGSQFLQRIRRVEESKESIRDEKGEFMHLLDAITEMNQRRV
ncbi:autophagy protein Apg9-domain-containing protein [Gorgonomyces haynaldii]|nr:autophagy protein Apg9-domain-containing protein [Gorgonomyces haynaldii]